MEDNIQNNPVQNDPADEPGKGQATTSLILGIIAVVCCFFGYSALVSVVLGIIGLVFANKAKVLGNDSSIRMAGFILSLIGLIGGAVVFAACIACAGVLGTVAINMGDYHFEF